MSGSEAKYSLYGPKEGNWDTELGFGTSPFIIKARSLSYNSKDPPLSLISHDFTFTTKMAQVLCAGCNKRVSLNGLASHIRKTRNVRCRTVRSALQAPGSIPGVASSLASIPGAVSSFGPDNFLEFGANQGPRVETQIPMCTQEGKFAATRFKGTIIADHLYFFGDADSNTCPT